MLAKRVECRDAGAGTPVSLNTSNLSWRSPMSDADSIASVEYRIVPEFHGYYVGNDGSVWTCKKNGHRRMCCPKSHNGYEFVRLFRDGSYFPKRVNRLIYECFVADIPDGMQINHIDCNKLNNRLDNLECITAERNREHAKKNNLYARPQGDKHPRRKLSSQQVLEIRASSELGIDLAAKFAVHPQTIYRIRHQKLWSHI